MTTEPNIQPTEEPSTEQRILLAAEQEFLQKGFAGSRTTAIAEAAGVTHAMLHYYFRTKEKLFGRVIADKLSALANMFFVNFNSNEPLEKCISEAVRRHFDFVVANKTLPRFMVSEVFVNPQLMDQIAKSIGSHAIDGIEALQRKIDTGADRGECRRIDARQLVIDIVSLNVFPLLALPLIERMVTDTPIDELLRERREQNVNTILTKLFI